MDVNGLRKRLASSTAGVVLLAVALTACVAPTSIVDSPTDSDAAVSKGTRESNREKGSRHGVAIDADAGNADLADSAIESSKQNHSATRSLQSKRCDRPEVSLSPLSTPEDAPVFEQFNFQPQRITATSNEVTINTSYHTFSYCKNTGEWTIANRPRLEEAPFNYTQYLKDLAEPSYETIEVDGDRYEYRIRLQASWIEQQITEQTTEQITEQPTEQTTEQLEKTADTARPSAATTSKTDSETANSEKTGSKEAAEEAVYFDLKRPDGTTITQRLYTREDVREASLGASLGVPSIAAVVDTEEALWFAATTSQGEGENGFASLLRYSLADEDIAIHQPPEIQGDQITTLAATSSPASNDLTLWLGTLRSAEGTPAFPASGLVSYRPTADSSGTLRKYKLENSPIVGAIPYQIATVSKDLWIATGNGVCQTQWLTIEQADSWRCWKFTATAALPAEGVDLYPSFLAKEPKTKLTAPSVEVLWANWEHFEQPDVNKAIAFRYEVAYEEGFEADLAQGGHRIDNKVAQQMARGNDVSWPGQHWHWSGRRFERSLDEVSLNLLGGGPYGLIASNIQTGLSFDHYAIRGDFDLLSLKPDGTRIRYYSGWVEGKDLEAYPDIVEVNPLESTAPNPITSIVTELPPVGP